MSSDKPQVRSETSTITKMSNNTELSKLTETEIVALAAKFQHSLTPPGHMLMDRAVKYMAEIMALFQGESEVMVKIAIAGWAALHDVGSVQNFAGKPPIVCGTKSVPAVEVFGKIIPVDEKGEPRQFCATMFEKDAAVILKVLPQLVPMLSARSAEAGLPASSPMSVISYFKGVTPATAGSNVDRNRARGRLLTNSAVSRGQAGAAVEANSVAHAAIGEAEVTSGHNLY